MRFSTLSLLALGSLGMFGSTAQAETIVNTSTTAIFDVTGGNDNNNVQTPAAPNNNNGLTINVTFTPSQADLDETDNAINLVEIGGNANGSGLYLLGGQVFFISKMAGVNTDVPSITTASGPDLVQNEADDSIGVRTGNIAGIANGGVLTAGTEYSVAAILDIGSNTVTLAIKSGGGNITSQSWGFTRDSNSWSGNRTIVSFNPAANAGGGSIVNGDPFQEGVSIMTPFSGTAGQALVFNEVATLVPEPSSLALLGLGGLLIARRRRD